MRSALVTVTCLGPATSSEVTVTGREGVEGVLVIGVTAWLVRDAVEGPDQSRGLSNH
jgi:hypothetical protein